MSVAKLLGVVAMTVLSTFSGAQSASAIEKELLTKIDSAQLQFSGIDKQHAEVNIFRAREIIARSSRIARMTMIFDKSTVATQSAWQLYTVQDIPLGLYDVKIESHVTLAEGSLKPLGVSINNTRWAETDFKLVDYGLFGQAKPTARFTRHSRQSGRNSETTFDLGEAASALPYESLPLVVRGVRALEGSIAIALMEPLSGTLSEKPRVAGAQITYVGEEATYLDGVEYSTDHFKVVHAFGEDNFWFQKAVPRRLIKWSKYNGSEYVLEKTIAVDYWNKNKAKDRQLLFD